MAQQRTGLEGGAAEQLRRGCAHRGQGRRIVEIAARLKIPCTEIAQDEREPADPARIDAALAADRSITHVALVHCETTTGMLNPAEAVGKVVREHPPRDGTLVGVEFLILRDNGRDRIRAWVAAQGH